MRLRPLFTGAVSLAFALPLLADDWPQWRGANRTGISRETRLLKTWPAKGPTLLWKFDNAGIGYAGVSVVGGRLYTMGARDGTEHVYALDVKTGKEIWATPLGTLYENRYGDGPRGTPTVEGDVLYTLSGNGDLACVETATGKKRWTSNLRKDLKGQIPNWGYTESPLIDGDKLICTPGGREGTVAALDKKTGKKLWQSAELKDPAAYASAIVAEVGDTRHYIQMTMRGVAGVAAADGKLLWHYLQPNYRTAVIPTPIFSDNHVFVTSGYGAGCDLLKLIPDGLGKLKAEKVYANKNMVNHHGGVIKVGDHLYGYSDGKGWVCQDFKTGKNVWEEKSKLGKGSLTCADGRLYCYSERGGNVVLIEATPEGWKESGRFKIPQETTRRSPSGGIWTHPVVANGRLYLRDQELLFCFDIRDPSAAR